METIQILAPFGRDAELASAQLEKEGFTTKVIKSINAFNEDIIHSSGALLLTEEALATTEYLKLQLKLSEQEAWSDIPIILLISSNDKAKKMHKILEHFSKEGNITLLERPFRLITLVTAINVALRGRRRQFLVKELLKEQEISLRSRDEFLSIASHELKTPITTLKLQVQMRQRTLRKGDLSVYSPPKVNSLLDSTEHQVGRLERLVDDMLDISRIENGKLNLHFEEFDLGETVSKTYYSLADAFTNAKCPVAINIDKNIIGVWDKSRIEQVIINLFTNAIKYGASSKVEIEVKKENDKAILKVSDHGMGIAEEDQERVFQRFERAVSGGNISGLGLGLFITREILEMQGGTISLQSQKGKGAAFTVELPVDNSVS